MHRVTTLAHQLLPPITLEERQQPIVTNMGKQQVLPPHRQTISEERRQRIEIDMEIPSVHLPLQQIIWATPRPPIETVMGTQLERIDQAPTTLAIPTPVTLILTETLEAHLPPQLTTSATPRLLIATETDTLKVLLHLPQIILAIATHNSAATTPTQPSGLGNDTSLHTTNPESSSASYFRGSIVHESRHVVFNYH